MKVLMLNGSPKANGNTNAALLEVGRTLENEGISYEIFQMGGKPVRDCIGCGQCSEKGCAFNDDDVNEFIAKAKEADGFVFGTPVYYAPRADVYCHSLTERSTQAVRLSDSSPAHRLLLQDEEAVQHRSIALTSISA